MRHKLFFGLLATTILIFVVGLGALPHPNPVALEQIVKFRQSDKLFVPVVISEATDILTFGSFYCDAGDRIQITAEVKIKKLGDGGNTTLHIGAGDIDGAAVTLHDAKKSTWKQYQKSGSLFRVPLQANFVCIKTGQIFFHIWGASGGSEGYVYANTTQAELLVLRGLLPVPEPTPTPPDQDWRYRPRR